MKPTLRSRSRRDEDHLSEMKSKSSQSSGKENIKQQQPRRSLLPIFAIFVFSLFATYFYSNRSSSSPSFKRIPTFTFSTKDSLRFTVNPPRSSQSYAICSFGSYPPSKTSQKAIPRIYTVDPDQERSHGQGGPTQCITINDGKVQSLTDGQKVHEWCLKMGKDCDVRVLDVSMEESFSSSVVVADTPVTSLSDSGRTIDPTRSSRRSWPHPRSWNRTLFGQSSRKYFHF